ncbi:MAG: phosphoenolpyruvate carboxykinase, partial [Armatimonadota bacterium]
APMVCIERTMGDNSAFNPHCTLYVSTQRRDSVRLAYMWGETLFPYRPTAPGPDMTLIYVPEWEERLRQILVFPEESVTLVLGSDYVGESKKGFLRKAMWRAKHEGMLGVHSGAKIVRAVDPDGKMHRYGMLLFGLSATGKTTHSCHDHDLGGADEGIEVVQDDVCFLCEDGSALGTERGFYLKTEGLDPHSQPLLYHGATQRSSILENVMVDAEGRVDFHDETLTSNGRCVVQMSDLAPYASDTINLPPVDETDGLVLMFITRRNTVLPMVSKLNAEQAALAFVLGESVESSAGDPRRAGESVRVVGTNPFIIGDEAAEANWIYALIKSHEEKVQAYLINTGGVGEIRVRNEDGTTTVKREVSRIQIPETSAVFRAIVRGEVDWIEDPHFGTLVPREIEGVDLRKFDPHAHYGEQEIEDYALELKRERREYLERFPELQREIVDASAV